MSEYNKSKLIWWIIFIVSGVIGGLVTNNFIGIILGTGIAVIASFLLGYVAMGLFRKKVVRGLVKDKLKKEWAENIYKNISETKGLEELILNEDKALIEQLIEKIFQSAKDDETRLMSIGITRWESPMGIAYGAVNLIKPTDTRKKRLLVTLTAFSVIQHNFGLSFNENGMQRVFEDSGWTKEEIDKVFNFE